MAVVGQARRHVSAVQSPTLFILRTTRLLRNLAIAPGKIAKTHRSTHFWDGSAQAPAPALPFRSHRPPWRRTMAPAAGVWSVRECVAQNSIHRFAANQTTPLSELDEWAGRDPIILAQDRVDVQGERE